MKAILVAALAQVAATGVFIFMLESYTKTHGGAEAWPVLLLAVFAALGLETLVLFLGLSVRRPAAFFKMVFAVLGSWAAGLAASSALDGAAWARNLKPPILAWLACLAVLTLLAGTLSKTTAR